MAQSQHSLPTSFNSSSLVRLLANLDIAPAADSAQTFAEKLSHWVSWTDAISLSSALGAGPHAGTQDVPAGWSARVDALVGQMQRLRVDLGDAVAKDSILSVANRSKVRPVATVSDAAQPDEAVGFDFAAYRRTYLAHQRLMEERIGALRAAVRTVAAAHSPALGQLAALDAALDTALAGHQRRVTANVPALLEKRFKSGHRPRPASPTSRSEARASVPGKPPTDYGQTLQSVLMAEMQVRLQPVEAMLQAIGARFTGQS